MTTVEKVGTVYMVCIHECSHKAVLECVCSKPNAQTEGVT